MNALVLVRVAKALDRAHRGSVLTAVHEDGRDRLRFEFAGDPRAVAVSLRPERPWMGTARARAVRGGPPGPFTAACTKAVGGSRVVSIEKDPVDRLVWVTLASGHRLAIELATHGANAVLIDRDGKVLETARHPRAGRDRLAQGATYRSRGLPAGQVAALEADADTIDRLVAEGLREGEPPLETLRRRVFGLGTEGASLILDESRATGATPGHVTAERLRALREGTIDPVLEGPPGLEASAELPGFSPADYRLLPWEPQAPHRPAVRGADAAETAGMYHEALDRAAGIATRLAALHRILADETARSEDAERKARDDVSRHESPERYRIWGEALLAGLAGARRQGDRVLVPDPYDAEGRILEVPAPASLPLTAAADDLFRKHRRAIRGLAASTERLQAMADRVGRLAALHARYERAGGAPACDELAERMRAEGIAVGLRAGTRAEEKRRLARGEAPRVEGVRIVTSSDGLEILVGRTARDNDRLTFRLAGPEDFWLHADGVPGAHVVVRNPSRANHPPERTLREAASLAAWYSDAREQGAVEVRWTRRKSVHRVRGAGPGTVSMKRFQSLRVRPASEDRVREAVAGASTAKDGPSREKDEPRSY